MKGQKTITVTESVYNKIREAYEGKKVDLFAKENVKSFTAYTQKLVVQALKVDLLEGRFEIINRLEDRVVVRDYFKAKDYEVWLRNGELYCEGEQKTECEHTGFVHSDPDTVKRAKELGIVLRLKATS